MKRQHLFTVIVCLLIAALAGIIASPVHAAVGTPAGTTITNNVTVSYSILGVPQASKTGSESFVVDRKIDLVVTKSGDVTTGPSATTPTLVYLVTNNSNSAIRIALSTLLSSTKEYTPTSVTVWKDTNGDGTGDSSCSGAACTSTFGDIASGGTITVLVTATTPTDASDGNKAGIYLIAQAYEPGSGAPAVISQSTGTNDKNVVDTVYADAAGPAGGTDDAQYDGKHSAMATFTVVTATVTVTKSSSIFSDPTGSFAPYAKAIPGATVEYTIVIKNEGGSSTAQSVAITDTLPATILPIDAAWTGTGSTATCNKPSTNPNNAAVMKITSGSWACLGNWSGQNLSLSVGSLSTGQTATIMYQAVIQ